jgi:hypothetical protein
LCGLRLEDSPALNSLHSLRNTRTDTLWIANCTGLRSLPLMPRTLTLLHVESCPNMRGPMGLPEGLHVLHLHDCPGLTSDNFKFRETFISIR